MNFTDPSGKIPEWIKSLNSAIAYEQAVLNYYKLEPSRKPLTGETVKGSPGCLWGPVPYKAPGYLEGLGFAFLPRRYGQEIVYDFATMERHAFSFKGSGGSDSLNIGLNFTLYAGIVNGFTSERQEENPQAGIIKEYEGRFDYYSGGPSTEAWPYAPGGLGAGIIYFHSPDNLRTGYSWFVGGGVSGVDIIPYAEGDIASVNYQPIGSTPKSYAEAGKLVNLAALATDILTGNQSPWMGTEALLSPAVGFASRYIASHMAITYGRIYNEMRE